MKDRAYSLMTVKSFDDDLREITGVASTPAPDRCNDTMDMAGVKFTLPMPLLWQHWHSEPIGTVIEAEVKKTGIHIKASLVKPTSDMPQDMIDRLNEAWASIKTGLVRGLSIGFLPIELSYLDNGGINFIKWEWYELSAVTVPANGDCNIQTIKSIDRQFLAASGARAPIVKLTPSAGVTAPKKSDIKGKNMNISEQIKGFEAKRLTLAGSLTALMAKAADEGRTLDAEEEEQYEDLSSEIKAVNSHLKRLQDLEVLEAGSAKPVTTKAAGGNTNVVTTGARAPGIIKVEQNLEKGIGFARFAKSLAAAKGSRSEALEIAKNFYPDDAKLHHVLKAAVAGGTTTDPTWAGNLVEYQEYTRDFIEFLRPKTIIGQFGRNGIPSLRNVPFNIRISAQTSGGTASWVGEGKPKPLTKASFENITFSWAKIAAITVLTDEMVRFSSPKADELARDWLADAVIERMDTDFVDPDKAAAAGVSPASITYQAVSVPSTGNPDDDAKAALRSLAEADIDPAGCVWLMSSTTALDLSMRKNPLGQKEYPEMSMLGGTFQGLPSIVSQYVGNQLVLVKASDIYLADDGGVAVDASREASLEMSDSPTNSSATGTGSELVSMWQNNSVAIRAERWINWQRRRTSAVIVISDVDYDAVTSS